MKKLLKLTNQALDMFEWHDKVEDERGEVPKPGYYCFKLEVISKGNLLYESISSVMYKLELDDNSRYEFVHDALTTIQEVLENDNDPEDYDFISEQADSEVPVYTYDLLQWLSKNLCNYGWVEEAIDECGWDGVGSGLPQAIMAGYSRAWTSTYNDVLSALKDYEAN